MSTETTILDEVRRTSDELDGAIKSLRERAMRLIQVAAVIAGLFAVATGDADGWQIPVKIGAIAIFIPVGILVLLIENPRKVAVGTDMGKILDNVSSQPEGTYSEGAVANLVSASLRDGIEINLEQSRQLATLYKWTLRLVAIQVIAWGLASL